MTIVGSTACQALTRLGGLLPVDPCALSDGQLVSLVAALAEARRHLDAVALAAAGEVQRRSEPGSADSLARRLGFKTAAGALQKLTGSSGKEAVRLVKDVQELKGMPAVEAAVLGGRIGRESAQAIAGQLGKAAPGAEASELQAAQAELIELATTASADEVKAAATEKAAALRVQAVQDRAEQAMRARFLWIGPTVDGAARLSGLLPAGHAAVIRGVFDALENPKGKKTVAFADPAEPEEPRDARTPGQRRADHFRDLAAAFARSDATPEIAGDHPTVWLSATAAELQAGAGLAFYAGTPEPVPVADAAQAACTGGTQTVIFGDDGRVLQLGRTVRGFTRRQRRAITLRDGGACLIPGCMVPAQWCEVHHVISYQDGGPTDVGNGVNLCWFHHHDIDTGPWRIRMRGGTPEVRYAYGGKVTDWAPAGNGEAARLRQEQKPPGRPQGSEALCSHTARDGSQVEGARSARQSHRKASGRSTPPWFGL